MNLVDWLTSWATRRALEKVRANAAAMRAVYVKHGLEEGSDPDPQATDAAILNCLYFGPNTARQLRMGGPGGVIETSAAIERLVAAGRIRARLDGRWIVKRSLNANEPALETGSAS
jgi:hypothetical protein